MADFRRQRVGELQAPERIQPVAAPVDTLVRERAPGDVTTLDSLAQALSALSPSLMRYAQNRQEEQNEVALMEGRKAAIREALDWQEAVKAGKVHATENPWFMRGYQEQRGAVHADLMGKALVTEYTERFDPETGDIDQFVGEVSQHYLEGLGPMAQDRAFMQSFMNKTEQHRAALVQRDIAITQDRIMEEKVLLLQQELTSIVETGLPVADVADQVGLLLERENLAGIGGKAAGQAVVDALAARALETGDPRVFEVMDHVQSGTGFLGKTAYAKAKREQVEDAIRAEAIREASHAWTMRQRYEAQRSQELSSQVFQAIQDGNREAVPVLTRELARFNMSAAVSALGFQATYTERELKEATEQAKRDIVLTVQKGEDPTPALTSLAYMDADAARSWIDWTQEESTAPVESNQEVLQSLYVDVATGEADFADVVAAVQAGMLSQTDARALEGDIKRRAENPFIVNDPLVTKTLSNIDRAMGAGLLSRELGVDFNIAMARTEVEQELVRAVEAGELDPSNKLALHKFLKDLERDTIDRWVPESDKAAAESIRPAPPPARAGAGASGTWGAPDATTVGTVNGTGLVVPESQPLFTSRADLEAAYAEFKDPATQANSALGKYMQDNGLTPEQLTQILAAEVRRLGGQ